MPDMSDAQWADYTSYQQNESIRQAANDRATQAYNRAKLNGESEDRALAAAKFAWQQKLDEATQTGMWNGQWSFPSNKYFTDTFGTWMPNGPTPGQETMAREQQTFGQGATLAGMYGQAFDPGQGPAAGTQTLAAQRQAYDEWLNQQKLALDQATQQQTAANQYLTLLSGLRGPADWAKYQEVLGAGGNMNSLAAAAMGQFVPGGGATSGMMPQAANLQTLYNQVAAAGGGQPGMAYLQGYQPGVYQPGGYQPGGYPSASFTPMGSQPMSSAPRYGDAISSSAAANAAKAAVGSGQQLWGPGQMSDQPQLRPGTAGFAGPFDAGAYHYNGTGSLISRSGWAGAENQPSAGMFTPQGSNTVGMTQGPESLPPAAGNGTNMYGAQQNNQMNLPAPNQVAAQSWNNMTPSQKEMMKGQWESQGWYKPDVEALMNQALPKYASNAATAGTWRLR